jgi:hypothetical protein
MPKYTVEDAQTGKRITFDWTGSASPTDADMEEVFAAGRSSTKRSRTVTEGQGGDIPRSDPERPWDSMGFAVQMDEILQGPSRLQQTAHDVGQAVLPAAGWATGVAAGTLGSLGIATGATAGAGLATGKKAADLLDWAVGYESALARSARLAGRQSSGLREAMKTTNDIVQGATDYYGAEALGALGTKLRGVPITEEGIAARRLADTTTAENKVDLKINESIDTAFRPSVKGRKSVAQREQAQARGQDMMREIIKNKNTLELPDGYGGVVRGQLPSGENAAEQLSVAMKQAMDKTLTEYMTMAEASGEKGLVVTQDNAIKGLQAALEKEEFQAEPAMLEMIQKQIDVLRNTKPYSPVGAENRIALLNERLRPYYADPTPTRQGQAYVDALEADALRTTLDDGISALEGPGHQQLKNTYGSIRSYQDIVNHRITVYNRGAPTGLQDFLGKVSEVGTAIHAIASHSPAGLAASVGMHVARKMAKASNNPNVIISKMFEDIAPTVEASLPKRSQWPDLGLSPDYISPPGQRALPSPPNWQMETAGVRTKSSVPTAQLEMERIPTSRQLPPGTGQGLYEGEASTRTTVPGVRTKQLVGSDEGQAFQPASRLADQGFFPRIDYPSSLAEESAAVLERELGRAEQIRQSPFGKTSLLRELSSMSEKRLATTTSDELLRGLADPAALEAERVSVEKAISERLKQEDWKRFMKQLGL